MIRRYHLLIVAALSVVAYVPSLGGPFIFDSVPALYHNTAVQIDGSNFGSWIGAAQSSTTGPLGRPISMLSFAFNHVLGDGLIIWQFKAVNLFIHLLNGSLLYVIARRLLIHSGLEIDKERLELVAFLGASLWLLHPLNVSTVLYTVQRMAQLSTLFTMLAIAAYLHFRLALANSPSRARCLVTGISWVTVLTILAALSKENGLLAPWLILLIESLFFSRAQEHPRIVPVTILRIGLLAPAIFVLCVIVVPPDWLTAAYESREFDFHERVFTQFRVLWQYLLWWLLPLPQWLGFHHDDIVWSSGLLQPISTLVAIMAWVGVLAAAIRQRQRNKLLLFCVAWFLIAQSLESSIVPLEMVYEHRNYLAGMSVCLLFALVVERLTASISRRASVVATLLLISVCWGALGLRASHWADELQMTEFHLRHHPESVRTLYHYANARLRTAPQTEALDQRQDLVVGSRAAYEMMLGKDPGNITALVALLWIDSRYFSGLDPTRWQPELESSLRVRHMHASDFNALQMLGECARASWCRLESVQYITWIERLIDRYPNDSYPIVQLARHYRIVGADYPLAEQLALRATEVNPLDRFGWRELVGLYAATGETGKALDTLRRFQQAGTSIFSLNELNQMYQPREEP